MEHLFHSVSALMSALLRDLVEGSIRALVDLMEQYGSGNMYEGEYSIYRGLALPTNHNPIRVFLVSG